MNLNDKLTAIVPRLSPVPGAGPLDANTVLQAHELPATISVRLNPHKPSAAFKEHTVVPWLPDTGRYLDHRPVFTLDPLFHSGAYYVQEASSMFVGQAFQHLVHRNAPLRVLDLCAAPGGKSTLLASLMQHDDLLIANEVIQPRAAILAENLTRWGQMNTWVSNNDPKDFARLNGYFDLILIDAPCTGSGLWRKDAEAINEWSVEHVKLCSERQKRIVADALPALKEGGILFYATCSYSAEENEDICDWLCDNLSLESLPVPVADSWHITATRSARHQAFGYRFYPWQLKGEGFFLAAFRKQTATTEAPRREKQKNKGQMQGKSKDETARWQAFLDHDFRAIERNGEYYGVASTHTADLELLQTMLRIRKTGTALGKIAGKDAIPDHELALSIHLSPAVARLPLGREEALLFLKKEEIRKDNPSKGWQVATYEGWGLGWGKWLPNRMNNYFPKNWRIRMDIK
ncbi:methyltransferase RsmF C-terminal domain-like protein [Taibaiella koreensis]|uniref:methyltransferase RsmF C-terminal domain-like protein n=1 Tax=Taibaiella koreensis TaxID=1268548 RepID=UPI000E5A0BF7|nr:RNA methyltransferase [Taibaiella koreensis]